MDDAPNEISELLAEHLRLLAAIDESRKNAAELRAQIRQLLAEVSRLAAVQPGGEIMDRLLELAAEVQDLHGSRDGADEPRPAADVLWLVAYAVVIELRHLRAAGDAMAAVLTQYLDFDHIAHVPGCVDALDDWEEARRG